MCTSCINVLTEHLYNWELVSFPCCMHASRYRGSIRDMEQSTHLLKAGSKLEKDGTIGIDRIHIRKLGLSLKGS